MRAAITGASGFIGKTLTQALLLGGHSVNVLLRNPDALQNHSNLTVFSGELPDVDQGTLDRFLHKCDVLFHLAGVVSRRPEDTPKLMRLHVDGTRVLLDAAARAGTDRIVLLSTSGTVAVSTDASALPDDTAPYALELAMNWPYYASKIYQEKMALAWAREKKASLIALRPSLVLGPGDDRLSSTGDVLKFLRRKVPVIPPGGLSFVDVRDVVDACITSASVEIPDLAGSPRTFLLGSANWTMEKFFRTLERLSGVSAPRRRVGGGVVGAGAAALRMFGTRLEKALDTDPISLEMSRCYWYLDASRAAEELGWKPRAPETTLADTISSLRTKTAV